MMQLISAPKDFGFAWWLNIYDDRYCLSICCDMAECNCRLITVAERLCRADIKKWRGLDYPKKAFHETKENRGPCISSVEFRVFCVSLVRPSGLLQTDGLCTVLIRLVFWGLIMTDCLARNNQTACGVTADLVDSGWIIGFIRSFEFCFTHTHFTSRA